VKRKEWHLHRESKKDSREGDPGEIARQQIPSLSEPGETGKIEGTIDKINSEKGEQHGHAAEKSVKKEFGGGSITFFASPDFYQEKRRDQAHLIEEKPENEILSRECTVKRGLHD
jgi:hypothetical protein